MYLKHMIKIIYKLKIFLIFFASLINACPAPPYPQNLTQPNGDTFIAQIFGDEWANCA